MNRQLLGIHHVTAIAGDPQQNLDFYTRILGLRLVKLTVNFDDPSTYHLYFGDQTGRPGSLLTFFPWPGAAKGRRGKGQIDSVAYSVPHGSLGFWIDRLHRHRVQVEGPSRQFNEDVLTVFDPDGLRLELVPHPESDRFSTLSDGPVPLEQAVIGIHSVSLLESNPEQTEKLLTQTLSFRRVGEEGIRTRFETGPGGHGSFVQVVRMPDAESGRVSVGTIHHVAWRTPADDEQSAWREAIVENGIGVTPIIDRMYFHSIYFREPGGALFEIATDPPGFTVDEEVQALGTRLVLPPWLEANRKRIERSLPRLVVAGLGRAA